MGDLRLPGRKRPDDVPDSFFVCPRPHDAVVNERTPVVKSIKTKAGLMVLSTLSSVKKKKKNHTERLSSEWRLT